MTPLHLLRQLADQQQFAELKATAQSVWAETPDPQVLPLLVLARLAWCLMQQGQFLASAAQP